MSKKSELHLRNLEIFEWRFVHKTPTSEIAKKTGLAEFTIRNIVESHRARWNKTYNAICAGIGAKPVMVKIENVNIYIEKAIQAWIDLHRVIIRFDK